MGLPGSGKSYFAKHLSSRLKCVHISSDDTRQKMAAMGKYSMKDKMAVYGQMASAAKTVLEQEGKVILDATFFKKTIRDPFVSLAMENNLPYVLIWIEAPMEVTKERLSKKREDSEADFEVYRKLAKEFEKPEPPYLKLVSRQDNIQQMVRKAENYLLQLL